MGSWLPEGTNAAITFAADETVAAVVDELGSEHVAKGGYLRICHLAEPDKGVVGMIPLFADYVGGVANHDRVGRYELISEEKTIRLAEEQRRSGHVCAWQSRDPDSFRIPRSRFGGAVLIQADFSTLGPNPVWVIISFSGLPEAADEAVCLLLATLLDKSHVISMRPESRVKVLVNVGEVTADIVHRVESLWEAEANDIS